MSWTAHPLVKAFRAFVKQSKSSNKETVKYIGQDHTGNRYFEAYRPNHTRQTSRFFKREKVENFSDVVDAIHVPPAWDSWLRFRRKKPPTEEEVLEEEEYFKTQQTMAAQRKAQKEPKLDEDLNKRKRTIPPTAYRT